jgi:hypothetical protein
MRCRGGYGAVAIAVATFFFGGLAHADILTFDDISAPTHGAAIPNGYGGFNWDNFSVLDTTSHEPSGYNNGVVSNPNVAFNSFGGGASLSGPSFAFDSAYFTAAWNDGLKVSITGYLSGVQVDQASFIINTSGPTLETFNWGNVDTLQFVSSGGTPHGYTSGVGEQFAMDNFTFDQASQAAAPLPMPASAGVGLLGALGFWMLVRRRRLVV